MRKAERISYRLFLAALHGGYWVLYLALLIVIFLLAGLAVRSPDDQLRTVRALPLVVICVVPNLLAFYASYGALFHLFKNGRYVALLFAAIAVGALSAFTGIGFAATFYGTQQPIFGDIREFASIFAGLFTIAAIHLVTAQVIRGFVAWFDEITAREELARRNFEIEIELVKSQINPHFLFNTLNNIDVLIGRDAVRASQYLNRLSEILRFMVYESAAERIPLARELDYLENYVELQRIRTSNADYVKFQIGGDSADFEIAPLILFPFAENAFKHTERHKNSASIGIKATIFHDKLVFECENPCDEAIESREFGGLGNELIKRRLDLVYPGSHTLKVSDSDRVYRVELTILRDDQNKPRLSVRK